MYGTVKWFNNAKGFGFICPANGGEDTFAHFLAINNTDKYKCLKAGPYVTFDTVPGPNGGLHAANIIVVPDSQKPVDLIHKRRNYSEPVASAKPAIPVRYKAKPIAIQESLIESL